MNSLNNFDSYRLTEKNTLVKPKKVKRIKFAKLLILALLLIILIISIDKIYSYIKLNQVNKKIILVKPVPDFTFEDQIKNLLKSIQVTVATINKINTNDYEAIDSKGLRILFTKNKELNVQLTSLQLILERFRIDGRQLKKVDLRFKNPIIE